MADTAGNTLTFQYTGGNLTKVSHSDGRTLTLQYSGSTVSSITDDQNRSVSYTYANGFLTTVTDNVSGNSIAYAYNAGAAPKGKALSQVCYPDSSTLDIVYDEEGRVAATSQNGDKQTTIYSYETAYLSSILTASGGTIKTWYGPNGEVLQSQDVFGGITKYNYDTNSRTLLSVTAPNGTVSKMEYDNDGNLSSAISPSGYITDFVHDDLGLLTSFTDARGNSVKYDNDAKGNTTAITYVDGSAEISIYDSKNQVTSTMNRRGQTITYVYDNLGRMTQKTYPDGRQFNYAYNAKNQLLSASDTLTGMISFSYDAKDRLATISYPNGKGFTYQYDSIGRLAKRISEDGYELNYHYSTEGRLESLTDKTGKEYIHYTYDTDTGQLAQETRGNGTKTTYAYDVAGRIQNINHLDASDAALESFGYHYDKNYQIDSMTSNAGATTYGYDTEGQLTMSVSPDGNTSTYSYDSVGNRMIANGAQYATNNLNQYTVVDGLSLQYDEDGNLTRQGNVQYEYDAENHLTKITRADGTVWECQYDAMGNRTKVTDNGAVKTFVYDYQGLGNLNVEYDAGGSLVRRYIYSDKLLADESPDGARRYYHFDFQGSTRIQTNDSGEIVTRIEYDAFGGARTMLGESIIFGYVGAYGIINDNDALLFMRNRYYDPHDGRFIQKDPIGIRGNDMSFYRYCYNNPIFLFDMNGCSSTSCGVAYSKAAESESLASWEITAMKAKHADADVLATLAELRINPNSFVGKSIRSVTDFAISLISPQLDPSSRVTTGYNITFIANPAGAESAADARRISNVSDTGVRW